MGSAFLEAGQPLALQYRHACFDGQLIVCLEVFDLVRLFTNIVLVIPQVIIKHICRVHDRCVVVNTGRSDAVHTRHHGSEKI